MAHPGGSATDVDARAGRGGGGRTQSRAGVPERATGPGTAADADWLELADSPEGRRIEQKLRAEALARRGGDDEAWLADPSGHA